MEEDSIKLRAQLIYEKLLNEEKKARVHLKIFILQRCLISFILNLN
jgi:hypothetical protein